MLSNTKPELFFNHNMDIELTNGSHFNSLRNYVLENFPHYSAILNQEDSLYAYLEPKTFFFLEQEQEYRNENHPLVGVREKAFIDICFIINEELSPYEIDAATALFDLQPS